MTATLSESFAGFATGTARAAIPDDFRRNAWIHLIDGLGVGLLASGMEYGDAIRRYVAAQPTGDAAMVWGQGSKAALATALLANGTLAGALNYDDTHNESQLHPGAHLVPLAVGLGEALDLDGPTVIDALAIGNEIGCRLSVIAPGAFVRRGFHSSSVLGKVYAALMAARLRGLTAAQAVDAAGHAASQSGGVMQCYLDGSWTLAFHHGWTATSALAATDMAAAGFRGPRESVEGPIGLFGAFLAGSGITPDFARAVADLGRHWECRTMSLKPFATGCVIHPFLDAALAIVREHAPDWRRIARVTLPIADYLVPVVCEPVSEKKRPSDVFNARVSLQYLIAETLYSGRFDIHSVQPASLRDPALLALVDRTDYVLDPEPSERRWFRGWVRVEMQDGTVHERRLDPWRRMHVGEPGTEAEVEAKFLQNLAEISDPARARRVLERARALREGGPMRAFVADAHAILAGRA